MKKTIKFFWSILFLIFFHIKTKTLKQNKTPEIKTTKF